MFENGLAFRQELLAARNKIDELLKAMDGLELWKNTLAATTSAVGTGAAAVLGGKMNGTGSYKGMTITQALKTFALERGDNAWALAEALAAINANGLPDAKEASMRTGSRNLVKRGELKKERKRGSRDVVFKATEKTKVAA